MVGRRMDGAHNGMVSPVERLAGPRYAAPRVGRERVAATRWLAVDGHAERAVVVVER